MRPPILALKSATLVYAGNKDAVFTGLDFELRAGDRLGIVGENGSGKTSLLMALTGLHTLSSGTLLHNGELVRTKKDLLALRRDVGLVFQNADDQLFSPTVLEDVAFGLLNLGLSRKDARARAEAILSRFGMESLAECAPHQLSGGQKRMVALATTIVMEPKVLLLDEPNNDLDAAGRLMLAEILNNGHFTLAVVSHDLAFLEKVVSQYFKMKQGASEHHV